MTRGVSREREACESAQNECITGFVFLLDKTEKAWYNNKAVGREREFRKPEAPHFEKLESLRFKARGKTNLKKVLQNLLTNLRKCGILNKFAAKPDGSQDCLEGNEKNTAFPDQN